MNLRRVRSMAPSEDHSERRSKHPTRPPIQSRNRPQARVSHVILGIGLCLVSLAGCRSTSPPIELVPSGRALAIDDARANQTLAAYATVVQSRQALRGSARVAVSGPDFKLNRPQRIAIARNGRLRFEILGLFDQPAALLVTDGAEYGFYDASTGDMIRGALTPTLLWDLARIDLQPRELVGLLLAAPEPEQGMLRAGVWLEADGRIAIGFAWASEPGCELEAWHAAPADRCSGSPADLARAGGQLFFFTESGELVEVRSLEAAGTMRYRAFFEDYSVADQSPRATGNEGVASGVNFPRRVVLESPMIGSEARFQWKRFMFASELSDRLFQLPEVQLPEVQLPEENGTRGPASTSR